MRETVAYVGTIFFLSCTSQSVFRGWFLFRTNSIPHKLIQVYLQQKHFYKLPCVWGHIIAGHIISREHIIFAVELKNYSVPLKLDPGSTARFHI